MNLVGSLSEYYLRVNSFLSTYVTVAINDSAQARLPVGEPINVSLLGN